MIVDANLARKIYDLNHKVPIAFVRPDLKDYGEMIFVMRL